MKWKNWRSNFQSFNRNLSGRSTVDPNGKTVKGIIFAYFYITPSFLCLSYKNYGSGPTKYPLADMLQFVLEFATTKPTSTSPPEDQRPAASSPTPVSHPLSEPTPKDDRWSKQSISVGIISHFRTMTHLFLLKTNISVSVSCRNTVDFDGKYFQEKCVVLTG